MAPIPSSRTPLSPSSSFFERIFPRQTIANDPSIIPTTYGSLNSGPSPGTVVGIVLGSVGGFLILLWLLYTCFSAGNTWGGSDVTEEVVVRSKKRRSHASTHSRRVSETVEVRRAPSPIRVVRTTTTVPPERAERIVVEERREVRRDRSGVGGDDEVVVIEDHPRRSKSKRESRRDDNLSGYRTVDPANYGGVVGGRRK